MTATRPLQIGAGPSGIEPCDADLAEGDYPQAQRITLLMDNLRTHTGASLYKTLRQQRRAPCWTTPVRVTPKRRNTGVWLNLAECEFNVLSRQ